MVQQIFAKTQHIRVWIVWIVWFPGVAN